MKKELKLTNREDISPKCPHCEKELDEVFYKQKGLGFIVGKNIMYFCPSCLKGLGFAQSRMG